MSAIPVHIVTGFLGAGKTTFLNALLKHPGFARTALVINEFGETGLDHLFIEGREDGVVELSNGCLCCTIRGELSATLDGLPHERIDRVIVETTGLADPGPVLQAAMGVEGFAPGGLVTLACALNAPLQLDTHEEARRQIALADLVIVTKLDLIPVAEREAAFDGLARRVRSLGPSARVIARDEASLSPQLFDELPVRLPAVSHGHDHHHHHHHHDVTHHGDSIRSAVLRADRPMPRRAIEAFCELLGSAHAASLLRLKGLVAVEGQSGPLVLHGVHGLFHEPQQLAQWPDEDRETRIVVILQDMDPDFVRRLFAGFANMPMTDTPDREALTRNPLAVPGFRA